MREGAIRRDQDRRCQRRGKHKRAHGSSAAHSGLEAGGKYGLVLLALSGRGRRKRHGIDQRIRAVGRGELPSRPWGRSGQADRR